MPQYFIKQHLAVEKTVVIDNEDFYHLSRVRRVNVGDNILLRDNKEKLYNSVVVTLEDKSLTVKVTEEVSDNSQGCHLVLALALLKGKKYDLAIQKAVEVGVSAIVPIVTERTIPQINSKEEAKLTRWIKIANEAAKQCFRSDLPQILMPRTFSEYMTGESSQLKILAHPDPKANTLSQIIQGKSYNSVSLAIGPEGGFSPKEIELARQHDYHILNIGSTHFKAETAAIVIPAIVLYEINKF